MEFLKRRREVWEQIYYHLTKEEATATLLTLEEAHKQVLAPRRLWKKPARWIELPPVKETVVGGSTLRFIRVVVWLNAQKCCHRTVNPQMGIPCVGDLRLECDPLLLLASEWKPWECQPSNPAGLTCSGLHKKRNSANQASCSNM